MRGVNPGPRGADTALVQPPGPLSNPYMGERMLATWRNWSEEMWDDVRQLIRVRSVNTPEALMLSPDQNYFVRENLKLRLLNARLALLSRDETTCTLAAGRYMDQLEKRDGEWRILWRRSTVEAAASVWPARSSMTCT